MPTDNALPHVIAFYFAVLGVVIFRAGASGWCNTVSRRPPRSNAATASIVVPPERAHSVFSSPGCLPVSIPFGCAVDGLGGKFVSLCPRHAVSNGSVCHCLDKQIDIGRGGTGHAHNGVNEGSPVRLLLFQRS